MTTNPTMYNRYEAKCGTARAIVLIPEDATEDDLTDLEGYIKYLKSLIK